jgi:hypothetical protein
MTHIVLSPSSVFDVAAQRQPVATPSVPRGPETGLTYLLRIESVLVRVELGLAREVAREADPFSLGCELRRVRHTAYNIKDGALSAWIWGRYSRLIRAARRPATN